MEALSAGASVATFVTVALGTVKFVYETLSSVKDGPSNVKKAADAILQLRYLLEHLSQSNPSEIDDGLLNDVKSCIADLNNFAAKILTFQVLPHEPTHAQLWKRLRAFASEKDLEQVSTNIMRHCARLTLRLNIDISKTTSELKNDFTQSLNAIQSLQQGCQEQTVAEAVHYRGLRQNMEMHHYAQMSLIQDSRETMRNVQDELAVRIDDHENQLSGINSTFDALAQDLTTRFDSHETMIQGHVSAIHDTLRDLQPSSLSTSQATAIQDTLSRILQHLHLGPKSPSVKISQVIEEVEETAHEPSKPSLQRPEGPRLIDDGPILNQRLVDGLKKLGKLVAEKEQDFDTFADEIHDCSDILESLDTILDEAKQYSSSNHDKLCSRHRVDANEINYGIGQFKKRFALSQLRVNPNGKNFRPGIKRPAAVFDGESSYHELDLGIGILSMKRKKLYHNCSCNDVACSVCKIEEVGETTVAQRTKGRPPVIETVTNIIFLPRDIDSYRMLVASNCISRYSQRCGINSISFLAVNRMLPPTSEVFQVVREGRLQDLRVMLQKGEASLRDHDDLGASLLFYATLQPDTCQFLLENGLDPNHISNFRESEYDEPGLMTPLLVDLESYLSPDAQSRLKDSRKLLFEAGADPFLVPDPMRVGAFFTNLRTSHSFEGISQALKYGWFTIHELLEYQFMEWTILHRACMNLGDSAATSENIANVLRLGFDINVVNLHGQTCLHSFILGAGYRDETDNLFSWVIREQQVLVFLLQEGVNLLAVDCLGQTVSSIAYHHPDRMALTLGSYFGDLWDSALAIQGHSISKYRGHHRRVAEYTETYTEAHFELLWRGRESLCPYWNEPYVDAGYDGDDEL